MGRLIATGSNPGAGQNSSYSCSFVQLVDVLSFDSVSKTYQPVLWLNDFWILRDYLVPMNETLDEVPLHLSLYTLAGWKWQMYLQMNSAFKMQVPASLLLPHSSLCCTVWVRGHCACQCYVGGSPGHLLISTGCFFSSKVRYVWLSLNLLTQYEHGSLLS
jgi:Cleft lip and palate transmembrane protein 1 (CLPTM1)